jgi:hypothetical protein
LNSDTNGEESIFYESFLKDYNRTKLLLKKEFKNFDNVYEQNPDAIKNKI